jgi:hypothetical protein
MVHVIGTRPAGASSPAAPRRGALVLPTHHDLDHAASNRHRPDLTRQHKTPKPGKSFFLAREAA